MPRLTTENFGAGNFAWLGSRHALNNARTVMLDVSAFSGTADGYVPSGTPVSLVGGLLVPYNAATNAASFAGHVLTDQRVAGTTQDFGVPLFDHGRVVVDNVPGDFTAPTAQPNTNIVYI